MLRRLLLISAVTLSVVSSNARAQIVVTEWSLATAVQDAGGDPIQDATAFSIVTNPFVDSHSAHLGLGTAMTSYSHSWSANHASFHFDMAHVTPDLHNSLSASFSTGSIVLTTSEPLRAHLTGSYSYYLPVGGMDISSGLQITGGPGPPFYTFLDVSHREDTFVSPAPLSGIFTSDQTALIPAGTYAINYITRLNAFGNSGAIATGSGFFQLTLEPVPEPATLSFLSIIALSISCRRGVLGQRER